VAAPRHALGGRGYTTPSDKLNIAAVGAGGVGANNIDRCRRESIVSLWDVDDRRAACLLQLRPRGPSY